MHPFSIDTEERKYVIFFISIFSVVIAVLISKFLTFVNISWATYIDGPSTMVFFGFFCWFFDSFAWKWKIFRVINLVQTPNLNGVWRGEYSSSYINEETGLNKKGDVELRIEQTWTSIRIISENGKSVSCSEIAGIAINDNMGIVLRYQYKNEAKFDTVETMNCHSGFNKLRYYPNKLTLEGDYFNDKNRQTYGTLYYKKVNET